MGQSTTLSYIVLSTRYLLYNFEAFLPLSSSFVLIKSQSKGGVLTVVPTQTAICLVTRPEYEIPIIVPLNFISWTVKQVEREPAQ